MDYDKIRKLNEKLFFTVEDVARGFLLKTESARVLCSRYQKRGIFIRIKNNFYVTETNWSSYEPNDFYRINNFLQVPSYISFLTALSFYGLTTQVPRNYFENASVKRSIEFDARGTVFSFRKINRKYYFGFEKKGDFFIAGPEKALLDSLYLYSFGKYPLDFEALDLGQVDPEKLKEMIKAYPSKTRRTLKLCGI